MASVNISLEETKLNVVIGNQTYQLDVSNLDSVKALAKFDEKYSNQETANEFILGTSKKQETYMKDCKKAIDATYGKGTFDNIFYTSELKKPTLIPYSVVRQTMSYFLDKLNKVQGDDAGKYMEDLEEAVSKVERMAKAVNVLNANRNKYEA